MQPLCSLQQIPNGQAIECQLDGRAILIWRRGQQVFAYENRCPHARLPLQWQENQFMSHDGQHLQCSAHGALFEPETGYCVYGPCQAQSLTPVPLIQENGHLYPA